MFNNNSTEYFTNPRNYHIPIKTINNSIIYGLNYNNSPEGYRISPKKNISSKNSTTKAILGLGDSFMYGQGVKYKDIYLEILKQLLQDNNIDADIKNCAKRGDNLNDIVKTYDIESSKNSFNLVIYGFTLNDFMADDQDQIHGNNLIDFNNGGYKYWKIRKYSSIINAFLNFQEEQQLTKNTISTYINSFEGENEKKNFEKLKSLNKKIEAKNSRLMIVLFPLLYKLDNYPFQTIHSKLKQFCEKENIAFIDLSPLYRSYKDRQLWVNPTDHHPNEIAHQIAAKKINYFLLKNKLLN